MADAIVKATAIGKEVESADGDNLHPDLHISIVLDAHEVSRAPVPFVVA